MRGCSLFYLLTLISLPAWGQQANQFHSWWVYEGNYRIQEQLTLKPIYAWSRNDFVENWQQSLLGSGLDFHANKTLAFGLGYEWIERFPYGEQPLPHQLTIHRVYQKVVLKHQLNKISITTLLRWNQEFTDEEIRYFFINQIGANIPILWKKGIAKLSIKLSEGFFINHGAWANQSYFGQNRAYAGLNYKYGESIGLDLGYVNHYIVKQSDLIENNHTLFIKVTHSLAFNGR